MLYDREEGVYKIWYFTWTYDPAVENTPPEQRTPGTYITTLKEYRRKLGRNEPMGPIDLSKMNVRGGSVAIGHPFAATGARILATMAKLLSEQGSGRGLVSVCTAGGMGVTAILEAA